MKTFPPKKMIQFPTDPKKIKYFSPKPSVKSVGRYNRIFIFTGVAAIVTEVLLANPIIVHSILCYTPDPANAWWISFDQNQSTFSDPNFSVAGGGFQNNPVMIMAIQTQPAPIAYKYFPNGGMPVQSKIYFSARNGGAIIAPNVAGGYVEIDYSYNL